MGPGNATVLTGKHMFRLLRMVILVMFAFVAGMLFERGRSEDICRNGGGLWISNICVGVDLDD